VDCGNFESLRASSTFERLPKETQDLLNRMMSIPKEAAQEIEVAEATLESAELVVKVPKSPMKVRPNKDKYIMLPMHISTRNPQRTKLTLQETGKAINVEADEEESEEILVDEEDLEMKVET